MQKEHFFKEENYLSSRIPEILLQAHNFVQKPVNKTSVWNFSHHSKTVGI